MERKEFIVTCGYACLGVAAMGLLLEGCAGANYFALNREENGELIVRKSEFIQTTKKGDVPRKFVLLKTSKYNYPICIYKLNETEFSALLLECTHKGCELKPQGEFLVCPCHGSEFSNKGVVQNPPAEKDLHLFKTRTDNENVFIQI